MAGLKIDMILGKVREKDGVSLTLVSKLFSGVGDPNTVVTPGKAGDTYIDTLSGYLRYSSTGLIDGWLRLMTYSPTGSVIIIFNNGNPNGVTTPTKEGDLYYDNTTGELYFASDTTNSGWKEIELTIPINFGGGTGIGSNTLTTIVSDVSPIGSVAPSMVGGLYFDSTNFVLYLGTGLTNADWTELGYTRFTALTTPVGSYSNTKLISGTGNPFGIVDPTAYGIGVVYRNNSDGSLFINTTLTVNGRIQINYII